MEQVSEIVWKGVIWKAAYGKLSVKELLTILKGFGPMEILEFEKPGSCHGQLSISLSREGNKEITLYHLEILGEKRQGCGREILRWLKKIFKGELYVEDPGAIRVRNATEESLLFWIKMFREGMIDAMEGENCLLYRDMSATEIEMVEQRVRDIYRKEREQLTDK
jgi:hypothetical protein